MSEFLARLKLDSVWDPLRGDPRFQALLKKKREAAQPTMAARGAAGDRRIIFKFVIPGLAQPEPGIQFLFMRKELDYKVHPWTLPFGPTFGCSNSFQTNLSGLAPVQPRNDESDGFDNDWVRP